MEMLTVGDKNKKITRINQQRVSRNRDVAESTVREPPPMACGASTTTTAVAVLDGLHIL
jgi:hypothetical protein